MKTLPIFLAIAMTLSGCAQRDLSPARAKQVAKLERRGWGVLNVLGEVLEKIVVGTVTNIASDRFRADPERVGLRK